MLQNIKKIIRNLPIGGSKEGFEILKREFKNFDNYDQIELRQEFKEWSSEMAMDFFRKGIMLPEHGDRLFSMFETELLTYEEDMGYSRRDGGGLQQRTLKGVRFFDEFLIIESHTDPVIIKDPVLRWEMPVGYYSFTKSSDLKRIPETEETKRKMEYEMSEIRRIHSFIVGTGDEIFISSNIHNKDKEYNLIVNNKRPIDLEILENQRSLMTSINDSMQVLERSLLLKNLERMYDSPENNNEMIFERVVSGTKRIPREKKYDDLYALCFFDMEPKLSSKPTPAEISAVKAYRAEKRNKKFGNERSFR